MTNTDTADIASTVEQVAALAKTSVAPKRCRARISSQARLP